MGKGYQRVKTKGRISAGMRADRQRSRFASPLDKAVAAEVIWDQVAAVFDAARGLEGVEFVYLIGEGEDGGPLKIGLSTEPLARLRSMQTGNSRRLRIEHVLIGDRRLEGHLHDIWESFGITSPKREGRAPSSPGTEWFEPAIRAHLTPVVELAVEKQLERLSRGARLPELRATVIEAHVALGVDVEGDKPRLLRR